MKKSKGTVGRIVWFIIIITTLCLIPSLVLSQSRGIKVVAVDKATKEWKEIPLYNKTYAVIIGIDNYPNLLSEFQLSYAVSDAKAIERMLRSKFLFNKIYTLYDKQATKSNILDLLLNKLSKISKDDAVFVFFAGHGGQEQTDFGPMGFIVPQDGNFSDMRKVISMSTIRDDISKRIRAKHVFYAMDSCYSGILVTKRSATSSEKRRDIAYLKQIAKEPVRQVLTAGSANQEVLDGGPGGHSVFAGRFLEILDEADDFITANEISTLVKERVFSDAQARGHIQTPKSGELFGLGDFIFMPSLTKKLGSIEQQISGIEKELNELKKIEKRANQQKDNAALREVERKRKIAEAKLQAKKLEEERLKQEKFEKEKKEKERREKIAVQKKKEETENVRLISMQQELEIKRKQYKSSMVISLDEALSELETINNGIEGIKKKYIDELKKRVLGIARDFSENTGSGTLTKDEFETDEEYQARIKSLKSSNNNSDKFSKAMSNIETAYNTQIVPLLAQMKKISKNEFSFYGHDALKIALGKYNAEKEHFNITIASKNVDRPLYSQSRFQFVSKSERQAKKVGIRPGDMLVEYNNHQILPNTNWDYLKQTVITDTTKIKIDRNGKIIEFTIMKGRIGTSNYVDDYLKNLKNNQFVVNGELHVPRSEARKFKQDFLNGFVTAELKVMPVSHLMSFVTNAIIIDESNDKKYNLFKSRFINFGHNLTLDNKNGLIWLTKSYKNKLSHVGAKNYLEHFDYKGIHSWKLPRLEQIRSLLNTTAYTFFNFGYNYYQTISNNKYPTYQPVKDSTCCERWGYVVGVLSNFSKESAFFTDSYSIYKNRYTSLDSSLLFDSLKKLIWITSPVSEKKMTLIEAKKYIQELDFHGLKGWRLPNTDEFRSLQDSSIPGINAAFNFGYNYYQTISNNKYPTYKPAKDSTCCEHYGHVIGVM